MTSHVRLAFVCLVIRRRVAHTISSKPEFLCSSTDIVWSFVYLAVEVESILKHKREVQRHGDRDCRFRIDNVGNQIARASMERS